MKSHWRLWIRSLRSRFGVAAAALGVLALCTTALAVEKPAQQQSGPSVGSVADKPAEQKNGPLVGSVEMSTVTVALGFGYNWGSGTITIGKSIRGFRIENVKLGSVGVMKASVSGTVTLNSEDDFRGTYVGVEIGAVLGGGAGALIMWNERGTVLNLHSTQTGFGAIAGPGGMTVDFD